MNKKPIVLLCALMLLLVAVPFSALAYESADTTGIADETTEVYIYWETGSVIEFATIGEDYSMDEVIIITPEGSVEGTVKLFRPTSPAMIDGDIFLEPEMEAHTGLTPSILGIILFIFMMLLVVSMAVVILLLVIVLIVVLIVKRKKKTAPSKEETP